MNASSAAVFAAVVALALLAAWRTFRKGAPCECGGSRRICAGKCRSCAGGDCAGHCGCGHDR